MSKLSKKDVADIIQSLCVVVVDDNQYMRKMIRNLLVNCGIKEIYEAADGIAALDTIRTVGPDVVILDWEMPLLNLAPNWYALCVRRACFRCRTCRSSCSAATAGAGVSSKP